MTEKEATYELLARVRREKPVVHHLTNWVTIYDCAQIVKSIGGSPVMAHAPEEMADMVRIASALVLNIGTLTADFVEAMKLAAAAANAKGIPVVLDACGAGATPFRDAKTAELLAKVRIDVLKGNASEIARVAGVEVNTKGVDAGQVQGNLKMIAQGLARKCACVVVITGEEDIVTDGRTTYAVANGHELMTAVVGTGCMAASVIGTFAAVERDYALASACALAAYGLAGESAALSASGPASFKQRLFDSFYRLDQNTVFEGVRVSCSR